MTAPYPLAETAEPGIPEGFRRLMAGGPFFRSLGPVYARVSESGGLVIALRIATNHLNTQGVAHGGMLTTFADTALGINLVIARDRRSPQVTVSFTADFLSEAREGDWLEAHATVTRVGKRLAYANCDLWIEERQVLRSSAVFAIVERQAASGTGEMPLGDG